MRVDPNGFVAVKPRRPRFSGINISQHVNMLLSFRNREEKLVFEAFQVQQSNKHLFLFFQLVENFIFVYGKFVTYKYYPTSLSLISLFVTMLTPVLLGWMLVVMYYRNQLFTNGRWKYLIKDSHIPFMESMWLIGTSISYALTILSIGQNGPCTPAISGALSRMCGCNYSGNNELPEDKMIGSFFFPIMYSIIFKGIKYEAFLFALVVDVLSVFFTMQYYHVPISVGTFVFYLLFSTVVLYENRRQRISEFLVTQSQQDALDEVERLAEETHAKELRSMIGNVAHDLKTPVTAFVSGMEIQTSLLTDMNAYIDNPAELQKCFTQLQESIQTMSDVNRFMMMSINRCIDYTKASNGVKLVPRLETVNFRNMLNLPLNCMKNIQNSKVVVELKPINDNIAVNIITDPQWFQENLLCLLSNAVKYSSEGTVTISAILTTKVKVGTMSALRSLASTKESRLLRVDVEDTGIGIADDVKQQLFSPFKQAQRLAGGTGLGLYSLARRLEALDGLYGVENRRDGQPGSNFWFAIPYRYDDTDDKTPPLLKKENSLNATLPSALTSALAGVSDHPSGTSTPLLSNPPSSKSLQPKLHILLVDDSHSILKMTGKMLSRIGHTVTTAENGAVALKLITNTFQPGTVSAKNLLGPGKLMPRFDVVLMDLQMPVMDGLEATKRLRTLEETYNSQVLISSDSERTARDKYRPVGVHEVEEGIPLFTSDPPPSSNSSSSKFYSGHEKVHQLIIGVSACSDDVTTGEAFAAGVDEFIPKPFSMQNFNDIYSALILKRNHPHQQ